jgi:hypothetical protein
VGLWLDFAELIERFSLGFDTDGILAQPAQRGCVEEQIQCQFLILAADELQDRRVDAVDADLGDLRAFVARVLGRVELDLEKLVQRSFGFIGIFVEHFNFGVL